MVYCKIKTCDFVELSHSNVCSGSEFRCTALCFFSSSMQSGVEGANHCFVCLYAAVASIVFNSLNSD